MLATEWADEFTGFGHVENSPIDILSKYFSDDLFESIANETNIYTLTMTGVSIKTNAFEIRQFFGINILMGNIGYPRIRMYWQKATRNDSIANAMTVNRFFKIRKNIHCVAAREPDENNKDKFWNIKPVVESVRNTCLSLPREEYSSVDEQMIPFTGRMPAKQVVKSKPNPVGLKSWVLCGKSGRVLDFEFYQGAGTGIPEVYKQLGLGAAVVLRLAQTIPNNKNYKICFDNFFTGMPLLKELKTRGTLSLGTLRENRMMGCQLKSEKQLGERGAIDYKVSCDGDICVVRWLDNGVVTLASTFAAVEPRDKVKRWSASAKEHIEVSRPFAVQVYNCYMGGVDKVDFLISLYWISARTKKWPVRVMFHLLDLSLANSWLQYRDCALTNGTQKSNILDLLGFRNEVGECLIMSRPAKRRSIGRPRSSTEHDSDISSPTAKKNRGSIRPVPDVRFDLIEHWPQSIDGEPQRCKLENCCGRSRIQCMKCNVHLCLNKHRNCFHAFHNK